MKSSHSRNNWNFIYFYFSAFLVTKKELRRQMTKFVWCSMFFFKILTIVAFICSSFIQIEWQKFKSKYGFLCVVKTIHIWLFRCDTYLIYARSDVTSIISYYNQDWNIQIYASYIIVWSIKSKTIIIAPQKWVFFNYRTCINSTSFSISQLYIIFYQIWELWF